MSEDDLVAMAVSVIDGNRYMTLGTAEPDGSPRLSPVYFTHDGYLDFFWVSSPQAQHSRNLSERSDVSAVIFDSSVQVGQGRAVYLTGTAALIPDDELSDVCARAFLTVGPDARAFAPHELSGDALLRLYRLRADKHEVHIPGRHRLNSVGVDTRMQVAGVGS